MSLRSIAGIESVVIDVIDVDGAFWRQSSNKCAGMSEEDQVSVNMLKRFSIIRQRFLA